MRRIRYGLRTEAGGKLDGNRKRPPISSYSYGSFFCLALPHSFSLLPSRPLPPLPSLAYPLSLQSGDTTPPAYCATFPLGARSSCSFSGVLTMSHLAPRISSGISSDSLIRHHETHFRAQSASPSVGCPGYTSPSSLRSSPSEQALSKNTRRRGVIMDSQDLRSAANSPYKHSHSREHSTSVPSLPITHPRSTRGMSQ
jgi:hypothetical protein